MWECYRGRGAPVRSGRKPTRKAVPGMVRKKVEGDEDERRAAAHEAEKAGDRPSARGETTGASKQPRHLKGGDAASHEKKVGALHRGKQEWRAGDLAEEDVYDKAATEPTRDFRDRGTQPYDARHERVFRALAEREEATGGEAVPLHDVAQEAGLPLEETRVVLHDLVSVHRLANELQESEAGALYQVASRA